MNDSSGILLERLKTLDDPREQAEVYIALAGRIYAENPTQALEYAHNALQHAESLQDNSLIAHSLKLVGVAQIVIPNVNESLEAFQRSLEIFQGLGDRRNEAALLDNIGSLYGVMGRFDLAIEVMTQSLEISEELDDKKNIAKICNNLSTTYKQMADFPKAMEFITRCLVIRENNPDNPPSDIVYINVGNLYMDIGDFEKTIYYYQKALEYAELKHSVRGCAAAIGSLGMAYSKKGEVVKARELLERAIELHQSIHDRFSHSRDLMKLGELSRSEGKIEEALEHFTCALTISVEADKRRRAIILLCMCEAFLAKGQLEDALAAAREALDISQNLKLYRQEYEAHELLGSIFEKKGDFKNALDHFKEFTRVKTEAQNAEKQKLSSELHAKFMVEKAEREKEFFKRQNAQLNKLLQEVEVLNDQLRKSDTEKNDLLSIIVHDLKNPLSGIRMLARFLKERYPQNSEIMEAGEDIEYSVNRMFELIEDLLQANKIESGLLGMNLEECHIWLVINRFIKQYERVAEKKNITLISDLEIKENTFVSADTKALMQILDNLISNAIKYSPHGRTVTISARNDYQKVQVIIRDEGPGLTDDDKSRLFKKFARLTPEATGGEHSTGLGLYIVKKLTEAMNCHIYCESELGQGAAFIVELPLVQETIAA
ncbi:MAG TPA: tetratricopeptide repeat protein [Patescibacteria group bacterium]|nr:tetratricopeptide repeat protein [Patescibacteria group bacterium]